MGVFILWLGKPYTPRKANIEYYEHSITPKHVGEITGWPVREGQGRGASVVSSHVRDP